MSVWKKLVTAIKGGATEVAEAVADSQAIRILEQELRDAREELRRSDESLTSIMAKRKLGEQKVSSLEDSIAEYEKHARSASDKGDTQLALDCAQKVVEIQSRADNEREYVNRFNDSERSLRANIVKAKDTVRRMEQQLDMVKATESVQKAQVSVSSRHLGANSKMKTAAESLQRIQEKQKEKQAQLEAAAELANEDTDSSLEKRLQNAGIKGGQQSAEDALSRILNQK